MNHKEIFFFICLIILLPILGMVICDTPINFHRLFSPDSVLIYSRNTIPHQPFSLKCTLIFAIIEGIFIGAFFFQMWRKGWKAADSKVINKFPMWGWTAVICLLSFWIIAWTRPSSLFFLNLFAFPLLWCSYILIVNAFTWKRTGKCLLLSKEALQLFVCSIPFWWYFEYLNRFVMNWYYLGDAYFDASIYVVVGSLAFSTVLPAVLSTRELILTFSSINYGFNNLPAISFSRPKLISCLILILFSIILGLIGVFSRYLFPFLWISPLIILVCLQSLLGYKHIFSSTTKGNYAPLVASALSALMCGFLWEFWNFYSSPLWIYSVPWVGSFKIFEMPMIGFLGYLPFGLECWAVKEMLKR